MPAMKTSTKGIIALMNREADVLSGYRDSKGIWTVGVGHTKAAGQRPVGMADRTNTPPQVREPGEGAEK